MLTEPEVELLSIYKAPLKISGDVLAIEKAPFPVIFKLKVELNVFPPADVLFEAETFVLVTTPLKVDPPKVMLGN